MAQENTSDKSISEISNVIDFGKIFRNYLHHWWWFAISLILCCGLAFIYVKKKSPVYLVKGLMMVNQEEEGGVNKSGSITAMLGGIIGGGGSSSNPENEMMKMTSQTNLCDVVNTLHLQYNYWSVDGVLRKKIWLYPNTPIAINMPQSILDTISVATKFHIQREKGDKAFTIRVDQDGDKLYEKTFTRFPYTAKTPYGSFTLTLTDSYNPQEALDLYAMAASTPSAVEGLRERLAVTYLSKKADAIQIDLEDVNIKRGEDVVNTIMRLYNDRRARDRYDHNKATLDFLNDRLLSLYNEIDEQDTKVEQFKRENRIVDAEAEASYIFTRMGSIDEQYTQAKTRLATYDLFLDMLTNPRTRNEQIPFTAADLAMSESYGRFMTSYNDLINQRIELEMTAKPGARSLDVLNQRIDALRETIITSLRREQTNQKLALAQLEKEQKQRDSRIGGMPAMEHRLLSFERDRVVKNQIYAYLLQKREETQISLSQQEPVGKIIDPAYPESEPVSPKKLLILAVAFLMGIIIPAALLQTRAFAMSNNAKASTIA